MTLVHIYAATDTYGRAFSRVFLVMISQPEVDFVLARSGRSTFSEGKYLSLVGAAHNLEISEDSRGDRLR